MTLYFSVVIKLLAFVMFTVMLFSPSRQLHTPTNLLLLSLAVCDFLVGLFVMPFQILLSEPCWFLGDLLCALFNLVSIFTVSASVIIMVLISVDRYVAICHPLIYPNNITERRIRISVLLSWIYSVLYSLFILIDNLNQAGSFNSCYGECVIRVNGAVDLVISFIVPISAIIILYMRVFVVAVSQARSMRSHTKVVKLRRSVNATVQRSELKAARTLGVIIAVFLMCYCPYYCVSLSGASLIVGSPSEVLVVFLIYFNSCLNPVIYAFLYPWFRKSVKLIVTLQILRPNSYAGNVI
ncbi:trace amine-associated receptor 7a-like [Betta splendens]|uniref:Trace amine-associated receptor 7a-like n=1 Tax=Betta splendens TaxID=158456 RepID=A0A9W2XXY3_BETSP|nr:trace amine-associated receptor 7a-like [Betta splendens]